MVVEALPGDPVQPPVQCLALYPAGLESFVFGQDHGFPRGEHAVEAAQHGHGQHDALVLRWPVGAAQQVRDLPDQAREIRVVRHEAAPTLRRQDTLSASVLPPRGVSDT